MPRRYSMDKRAGDHDATRRQILRSVIDVVAADGLGALTVGAVANQADVALRTVYNHFESRDAMLAAALGDLAEQTRTSVSAIDVGTRPVREQLPAFADAYFRSYEQQGTAVSVLMSATSLPDVATAVDAVRSWRREQIRAMARRAQQAGILQVGLAEATSIVYLATAYSTYAQLTSDAGLSPATARATVRSLVDRALFA